ncbi:hypothetical protein VTN77DRAFT_4184 [Rasamsonia byssochlamydoides]|uniref:uncharacterized protein n=1 Tax=Rasamsonia byssochlamydoides TaxID=89139 RepID=UPI0037431A2A
MTGPAGKMGLWQVLTLARYVEEDRPIMLKTRYELNPKSFGIEDEERNREIASSHVNTPPCHTPIASLTFW